MTAKHRTPTEETEPMKLRLTAIAGLGAMAMVALAGCGRGTVSDGPGYTPAPAVTTAAPKPTPPPAQPIVLAISTTTLGQAVTFNGRTVYRFDADSNNPPKSTCDGACLGAWPPLLTDGTATQVAAEIDSAKVGTVVRADGGVQVTLNGWPLYLFGKDKAPGDVLGEGVSGKWHVIASDGKPLKKS
jgi:predicted lipoprotein with Yx(FWY)xxD motif